MDKPVGADQVDFDRRVPPEFKRAQFSSVSGLRVMHKLDDALGLSDTASDALRDNSAPKILRHCRAIDADQHLANPVRLNGP